MERSKTKNMTSGCPGRNNRLSVSAPIPYYAQSMGVILGHTYQTKRLYESYTNFMNSIEFSPFKVDETSISASIHRSDLEGRN